ncbi:CHAT domain-containing protein [Fusarium sp. MPI-SDFR-AT-0072]|nr:CHAT domain-containing protein [Fusarium sp. MPI-SDFR-AT-0072]
MTSLVLEGNTGALLFWVDPKGAIGCCRWLASSGWQAVFDALPPGTANATTQLSVLSVGSGAYLFCVGPGGAVVGASWSNASSATLGLMTQFTVPSSGNAAPGGGLASFSVSAQEVAVVWTTPRNNVEMAVLNESEPFQNLQRPITVAQSVLGGTDIAAYSTGANQCSIWWIGQASDLRRTNVDLTKFRATLTPDWPVFEEVGPGSCKQMRSLIAQKVSGTQVDLLYVSANDTVAGLHRAPKSIHQNSIVTLVLTLGRSAPRLLCQQSTRVRLNRPLKIEMPLELPNFQSNIKPYFEIARMEAQDKAKATIFIYRPTVHLAPDDTHSQAVDWFDPATTDEWLNKEIESRRNALASTPTHLQERRMFCELSRLILQHYLRFGIDKSLDDAIDLERKALGYISTGFQYEKCLLVLGDMLCLKFRRKKAFWDMENSIRAAKQHIYPPPTQGGSDTYDMHSFGHGDGAFEQADLDSAFVDIDEGIDKSHAAFELIPDDFPLRGEWLGRFGSNILHRYSLSKEIEDIDKAVEICRIASDDANFGTSETLIEALLARIPATWDESDILEAIEIFDEMLMEFLGDRKKAILQYRSEAFYFLYYLSGMMEHINESVTDSKRAIDSERGSLELLSIRCHRFRSGLLYTRYQRTGDLTDLDDSMASAAIVAKILFTPGPKSKATLFSVLASDWVFRTEATADQTHFAEAIEWPACIKLFGTSRMDSLHELCLRHYERYEVKGRRGDLQDVVNILRQMVELVPSQALRSSLGSRLMQLYSEFNFLQYLLVEAKTIFRRLVEESATDSADHKRYSLQLAHCLCFQHERTGDTVDLDEAIDIVTSIFETAKADDLDYALALNNFGEVIYQKCRVNKTGSNVDHIIDLLQKMRDSTMSHVPTKPLSKLVECLLWKYRITDEATHLDSAAELARLAESLLPNRYPNHHCIIRHRLAIALHEQYLRASNLSDLGEAIELESQNLRPGQFTSYLSHANLTSLLCELYVATGDREHLQEAMNLERETRNVDGRSIWCFRGDRVYIPYILNVEKSCQLSKRLHEHLEAKSYTPELRARYLSSMAFMLMVTDENDLAMGYARESLGLVPPDSPDLPWHLCCLALCLGNNLTTSNNASELEEMITSAEKAVELSPEDHPGRPFYLSVLSMALHRRFMKTGRSPDLNLAIEYGVEAYNLTLGDTLPDYANRYLASYQLSFCLQNKYLRESVASDLEQSEELHQEARECRQRLKRDSAYINWLRSSLDGAYNVHLGTNTKGSFTLVNKRRVYALLPDKLDCHPRLFAIAEQYFRYYQESNNENYLSLALDAANSALAFIQDGHITYSARLHLVGRCYEEYYKRSIASDCGEEDQKDRLNHLDMAIFKFRELISHLSSEDLLRPDVLDRLGYLYSDKLFYNYKLDDLKMALEVHQECLLLAGDSKVERAKWLRHLGCSKLISYRVFRDENDLQESTKLLEQAEDQNIYDKELIPGLASVYRYIFMVTRNIKDINSAIEMYLNSPLPEYITIPWLGSAYLIRFELTKAPEDMKLATSNSEKALELARKELEVSDVVQVLQNLANCYLAKHHYGGTLDDIEQAIRYAQDAVDVDAQEASQVVDIAGLLGLCYTTKYKVTKCEDDLLKAIDADESDFWVFMPVANISDTLLLAQRLMKSYKTLKNWEKGLKIAEYALELIPAYTPRYLRWSEALSLLSRISGLASFAAAFSLQAGKPEGASLALLERGRGVAADLLYDLRLDFDSRKFANLKPVYKQTLLSSIGRLENPVHPPGLVSDDPTSGTAELTRRLEASKLVDEFMESFGTRLKPDNTGFTGFTRNGPIVVINVSFRCDAFIIQHVVETMTLPKLSEEELEQRLRDGNLGSLNTLEWLWDTITGPILEHLGYTEMPSGEWPQICWIPTGALSRFPLHAAGYHQEKTCRTAIDRVMSSYSSSLNAILEGGLKDKRNSSAKAVLVTMQKTPGSSNLPHAPKELAIVRKLCDSMKLCTVEPRRQTQEVLAELKDCDIFHFAGHGETDETNPLKSQLRLEDWQTQSLAVSDLLNLKLRDNPPFLAYLSACGTSQIKDKRLLDESLHLISACRIAGFRHVVGTLWEVGDEACVDVAQTVYQELKNFGMDDGSVCRGLHKAVRKIRDNWVMDARMRAVKKDVASSSINVKDHENDFTDGLSGGRSARDIVPLDEGENERPAPWVAYVYHGSR